MRTLTYYQVDVFTNRPFHGYSVAVLTQSMGLTDDEMSQISCELNLSATAFVLPSVEMAKSHNRIRHFTPQGECLWSALTTIAGLCVLSTERKIPVPNDGSVFYRIEDNEEATFPVEIRCRSGRFERVFFSRPVPEIIEPPDDCIDRGLHVLEVRKRDMDGAIQPFATKDLSMCFIPIAHEKLDNIKVFGGNKNIYQHLPVHTVFVPFNYRRDNADYQITQRFPLSPSSNQLNVTASDAASALIVGLTNQDRTESLHKEKGFLTAIVHDGILPQPLFRYSIEARTLGNKITTLRLGGEAVVVTTGKIVMHA